MSYLTTDPLTALAEALAALGGPANAQRTMGETEMLAAVHSILGATVSHKTTGRSALLAGIRNAISDAADLSHLTSSDIEILADIAGVSRLHYGEAELWALAMDVIASSGEGGGGGEEARQFLVDGESFLVDGEPFLIGE